MQYILTRLKIKPGKKEATEKFLRGLASNKLFETMATLDEARDSDYICARADECLEDRLYLQSIASFDPLG